MPVVPDWMFLIALLYIVGIFGLLALPYFFYFRVKGIERALWAIVSQLRATRLEQTPDVDPAATRRALEIANSPREVKMSMFGR